MASVWLGACADLPADPQFAPDPPPPTCNNGTLDVGEICDGNAIVADLTGAQNVRCTEQCSVLRCDQVGSVCPDLMYCDSVRSCEYKDPKFELAWSGDMPARVPDLRVADFDADGQADLISVSGDHAHVRRGDGSGAFGPRVDIPLPAFADGPVWIEDLDLDGRADLAMTAGSSVLVLRSTGSGLALGATLAAAADEAVLGVVAGYLHPGATLADPKDLGVMIATPGGVVLRIYVGAFDSANRFDVTDALFADLVMPLLWTAQTQIQGTLFRSGVVVATTRDGGSIWSHERLAAPPDDQELFSQITATSIDNEGAGILVGADQGGFLLRPGSSLVKFATPPATSTLAQSGGVVIYASGTGLVVPVHAYAPAPMIVPVIARGVPLAGGTGMVLADGAQAMVFTP